MDFKLSTLDSNPNGYLECRKEENNERIILNDFLDNYFGRYFLDIFLDDFCVSCYLIPDSNPNGYLECRREEKNERMICGAKSLGIFACLTKSLCHANRSLILLIGRSRPIFSRTEFTSLVFLINAQGPVSAQVDRGS